MLYQDLQNSPFFADAGLSYDDHGEERFHVVTGFLVTHEDKTVAYITHEADSDYITITYEGGEAYGGAAGVVRKYSEDLEMFASRVEYIGKI